jgi:phage terminase large subunit-like protein
MAMIAKIRSTFPDWVYDDSEIADPFGYGERAVRFLRALRHPKSALPNKQFQLDPWQERIVRKIYGPRNSDRTRIVSTVVLLLPRGNRKTSLSAALALLHTIGPERAAEGEAIFAAADRKQAGIAFKEARGIIQADKRLVKATRTYDAHNSEKKIVYPEEAALEVISGDAGPQHGRTPAFVLADEIHVWPNRDMWEALTTGLDKSDNPLLVVATTAGRGHDTLASEVVDDARKVARGEIDDPSILPILFEADRNADWRDEDLWHRVNPGLRHGYPSLAGFRRHAKRAERSVGERQSLRQLKLNIWLDQTVDPFVDMDVYDQGRKSYDLDTLKSEPCWLGVDLSSKIDLSVIVAAWRLADGYFVHPWFFIPEDNIDDREAGSGATYRQWVDDGLIDATPGNVIDHRRIRDKLVEIYEDFRVCEIAFDPALAQGVQPDLLDMGLPAKDMPQRPSIMLPAYHELERAILGGEFHHGDNPVLRHCFGNVVVKRTDLGHVVRFTKPKLWLSIDGAVAAAMAIARCATGDTGRSSYDDFDGDISEWGSA